VSENFTIDIIDRVQKTPGEHSELGSPDFVHMIIYDPDNHIKPLIKEKIGLEIINHVWRLEKPGELYVHEPDFFINYFTTLLDVIKDKIDTLPILYLIQWIEDKRPSSMSTKYSIDINNENWTIEGGWGKCKAKSSTGEEIDLISDPDKEFDGIYKGRKVKLIVKKHTYLERFEPEINGFIEICKKAKSENNLVRAEIS